MTNFSEYVPLFAAPTGDVDQSIADEAIHALTYAYLKMFKNRIERQFSSVAAPNDLFRIAEVNPSRLPSRHAWRPECSLAHHFLHQGHTAQSALQMGLAYAAIGQDVEVAAKLNKRVRLLFEGCLFECIESTHVCASNGSVEIYTENGARRLAFVYQNDRWSLHIDALNQPLINWVPIHEAEASGSSYIVYSEKPLSTKNIVDWPQDDENLPILSVDRFLESKRETQEIRSVQAFIDQYAKGYKGWTQRLLAGYFFCSNRDNPLTKSKSSPITIGLIYLKPWPDLIQGAENLIHETTHQHFFMCDALTPLTNQDDTDLYHSPLQNRARPIEMILFAAHALLNTLIYYQELMRNSVNLGPSAQIVESYSYHLKHMFGSLKKSCGLTKKGAFFVEHMLCAYEKLALSKAV